MPNVEINIDNIILKTERIILRPFKQSDLDDLYEYASVEGVGEMAGWQHHQNKETSQMILDNFVNDHKTFAIVIDGKVCGSLGIEETNFEHFPELQNMKVRELGFVLGKPYWGKGYMPEACKAVIDYLFNTVKLDAITCSHFVNNSQSGRVQEKLGFSHYRRFSYMTRTGITVDSDGGYLLNPKKNV